jgi:hypothetical protein
MEKQAVIIKRQEKHIKYLEERIKKQQLIIEMLNRKLLYRMGLLK